MIVIHNFFVRFVHPWLGLSVLGALIIFIIGRRFLHKTVVYRYSLGNFLKKNNKHSHFHKKILYILRVFTLLLLALLISRMQIVDYRSQVPVQGIDIVLALDLSGSMGFTDFDDDKRSRFEVAKEEAIRFIEKRHSDGIGLVLFAKDTVSRCPITFDKTLVKQIIEELNLGDINSESTMLITGMVTSANRLKHSDAKSKVMILLTDGEPSEGDMDPSVGIAIAKQLGIKVYTIGIGSEQEQLFMHPLYGVIGKTKVNKELLTRIARETGGYYFLARDASDMRTIYDKIDRLEKNEHEVPHYSLYYDLLVPGVLVIMALIIIELLLSTFVWFSL